MGRGRDGMEWGGGKGGEERKVRAGEIKEPHTFSFSK